MKVLLYVVIWLGLGWLTLLALIAAIDPPPERTPTLLWLILGVGSAVPLLYALGDALSEWLDRRAEKRGDQ